MPKETSRPDDNPTVPTLYPALELSHREWKLAFTSGLAVKACVRAIPAGDLVRLRDAIARARKLLALPAGCRVLSCYEAGRDGTIHIEGAVWLRLGVRTEFASIEEPSRVSHREY